MLVRRLDDLEKKSSNMEEQIESIKNTVNTISTKVEEVLLSGSRSGGELSGSSGLSSTALTIRT